MFEYLRNRRYFLNFSNVSNDILMKYGRFLQIARKKSSEKIKNFPEALAKHKHLLDNLGGNYLLTIEITNNG